MANNGSNSNSSGAFRATLSFAKAGENDLVDDVRREELSRAAVIELDLSGLQIGSVVYSTSPPADKTKLWQKIDGQSGIPIGQTQKYNATTGQWGNLVGADTVLQLSSTSDNLITLDVEGNIRVQKPRVDVLEFTATGNGELTESFADAFSYETASAYRVVGIVPKNAAGAAANVHVVNQANSGVTVSFANVSGSAQIHLICQETWEHILEQV